MLLLLTPPAQAQDQVFLNADGLVWSTAPAALPRGASVAVLQGDPAREGPFTVRLKTPGGYVVGPHFHTKGETLTVLSGVVHVGMGDVIDRKATRALKAGGFHHIAPRARHYVFTTAPSEVQISGEGPFDLVYVNAADDPSASAAAAK